MERHTIDNLSNARMHFYSQDELTYTWHFFTWIWLVRIITKVIKQIIRSSTIKKKVWMFALACLLHYHLLKLLKAVIVILECTFNIWTTSTVSRRLNPFWWVVQLNNHQFCSRCALKITFIKERNQINILCNIYIHHAYC